MADRSIVHRALEMARKPTVMGVAVAVALVALLSLAMLPLRSELSVATCALVLVVPVVVGAGIGGFVAGFVATVAGFLAYDIVFIKPYYTLSVGAGENWAALGVYAVVMVVVSRVVDKMNSAKRVAQGRSDFVRRVFGTSELLMKDVSTEEMAKEIVEAIRNLFELRSVALLLPSRTDGPGGPGGRSTLGRFEIGGEEGSGLQVAAHSGEPLLAEELESIANPSRQTFKMHTGVNGESGLELVALATETRPIGILALKGMQTDERENPMIQVFANLFAISLERHRQSQMAIAASTLERMEELSRSMVGAVSHDLRTPLATIKVATTSLLQEGSAPSPDNRRELLGLIEQQADRLERLVSNILDMTRIQSGSLKLNVEAITATTIADGALSIFTESAARERILVEIPVGLPKVEVDRVLVTQVLVNLVDNALRYSPSGSRVRISFRHAAGSREVVASVEDGGPGVPLEDRSAIFEMFKSREAGGRGGLGLGIAKAFIEAHGKRIWIEDPPPREAGFQGAKALFSMPVAASLGNSST